METVVKCVTCNKDAHPREYDGPGFGLCGNCYRTSLEQTSHRIVDAYYQRPNVNASKMFWNGQVMGQLSISDSRPMTKYLMNHPWPYPDDDGCR